MLSESKTVKSVESIYAKLMTDPDTDITRLEKSNIKM